MCFVYSKIGLNNLHNSEQSLAEKDIIFKDYLNNKTKTKNALNCDQSEPKLLKFLSALEHNSHQIDKNENIMFCFYGK